MVPDLFGKLLHVRNLEDCPFKTGFISERARCLSSSRMGEHYHWARRGIF
jgi:hypothetical protein